MPQLALVLGYVLVAILGIIGGLVAWKMLNGTIDLTHLISEANGRASFSRFQFLIFTFVVAGCVLILTLDSGEFPALGSDVLALLGISGGSYVVSKGIQLNSDKAVRKGDEPAPSKSTA